MPWHAIYGLLATVCGWTMAEIDALTFPEFHGLTRYWRDHPPVHLLLGAMLGVKPKKDGGLDELVEAFGATALQTTSL